VGPVGRTRRPREVRGRAQRNPRNSRTWRLDSCIKRGCSRRGTKGFKTLAARRFSGRRYRPQWREAERERERGCRCDDFLGTLPFLLRGRRDWSSLARADRVGVRNLVCAPPASTGFVAGVGRHRGFTSSRGRAAALHHSGMGTSFKVHSCSHCAYSRYRRSSCAGAVESGVARVAPRWLCAASSWPLRASKRRKGIQPLISEGTV
jgi:hypothetical protein